MVDGRACVLVASDDPEVHALLTGPLEDEGFSVETAPGGERALTALEVSSSACVVLDVAALHAGGSAALEAVRRLSRGRHLPVVVLTGPADDDQQWRAWSAGADYLFTAPLDPDAVISYVSYLVRTQEQPVARGA